MKTVLVIRIPPLLSAVDGSTVVQWGSYTSEGSLIEEPHMTAIDQLKKALPNDCPPEEIVLLLNGALCFYKHLLINAGQKKHLTTAVPFLAEEDLAQDIDTMHIIHGIPNKELQVGVAAVGHDLLQVLLTLFEEHELPLSRVVAESQFLPSQPDSTSLLLDHEAVMMTAPEREGITLNYQALPILFPEIDQIVPDTLDATLEADSQDNRPVKITLLYADSRLLNSSAKVDETAGMLSGRGWQIKREPLPGSVFEFFAQRYFATKPHQLLDFRQGVYRCPKRTGRIIQRWRPFAAVAGCWLLLELGLMLAQGMFYQQRSINLWQDSLTSYLAVFPNDRQARQAYSRQQMSFNVKQVLENRFRSLDQPARQTPFLPMLQALSSVSGQTQARSLEFNDTSGQLIYEFATDELAGVNRFVAQLSAAGLQSKLDSARQGESEVIARVSVRR